MIVLGGAAYWFLFMKGKAPAPEPEAQELSPENIDTSAADTVGGEGKEARICMRASCLPSINRMQQRCLNPCHQAKSQR